jgi:hypothetical protein
VVTPPAAPLPIIAPKVLSPSHPVGSAHTPLLGCYSDAGIPSRPAAPQWDVLSYPSYSQSGRQEGWRGCYHKPPVRVSAQSVPFRGLPVENLVILAILAPLLFMNMLVGLAKATAARIGRRLGPPEARPAAPAARVDALREKIDLGLSWARRAVTLLGFGLGVYAWVNGGPVLSVAWLAVVVMLAIAFRNGADLSRSFIYARHDAKLVRTRGAELPLGRVLAPTLALTIFTGTLFLALWAVLFVVVKGAADLALGSGAGRWALLLWGLGVVVGTVAHSVVAHRESGLLLRDDLGVSAFAALIQGRGRSQIPATPGVEARREQQETETGSPDDR